MRAALLSRDLAGRPKENTMHQCPHCRFKFEDAESLDRHLNEGRGCPALDDVHSSHVQHISSF